MGETKRTLEERVKEHTANIANNLSAVAEHHQKTGHKPDLDYIKVLCREHTLVPCKVRDAIFIRKETSPTLNSDGGRELSKIYDSLLETPRSRTPSTASSRSESVSQHSATIRWGRRRVSLNFSDQNREYCWTVLEFLSCTQLFNNPHTDIETNSIIFVRFIWGGRRFEIPKLIE